MKLLLLVLLAVAVILWLTHARKRETGAARQKRAANGEAMLSCAHCGAFFPASEAVQSQGGAVFCSDEHRLLHDARS